jgi:Tfp pilus assembly protein PilF
MVGSHPGNFKFVFGLALAEHNADYTEAALQLYQRVIELNPNFNKSYEMIAFIYLSDKKLDLA